LDLELGFSQEISSKLPILEICSSEKIKNMINYRLIFDKKQWAGPDGKKLIPVSAELGPLCRSLALELYAILNLWKLVGF
jgi:hypothetical protein